MGEINYFKAIKRPFTDFTKLLIGILFNILPIINFISTGYIFKCATDFKIKKIELPKWENFGDLFIDGLFIFLIDLLYFLPVLLFIFIFTGPSIFHLLVNNQFSTLSKFDFIILLITFLFSIVIMYILPFIKINYIIKRKFSDIFNFDEIYYSSFNFFYFKGWIIASSLYILVTGVSKLFFGSYGLTGLISVSIVYFVMRIIFYTIMGEVYKNV